MAEPTQQDLWTEAFGSDPFAPENVDTSYGGDFQPIPPGLYALVVDNAELRKTKAGDGVYVSVEMTVVEGQYSNRKLWDNLNIKNKSEVAQKIGQAKLATLATACGIQKMANGPSELVGKSICARVGVEDGNRNKVLAYKEYQPCGTPAPVADGSKPFWKQAQEVMDTQDAKVEEDPFG